MKRTAIEIQEMKEIRSYLIFIRSIYDTELFKEVLYTFIPTLRSRAMKKAPAKSTKIKKVIKEFKEGELHSGSKTGPVVSNPKQAIATGLSEQRKQKRK